MEFIDGAEQLSLCMSFTAGSTGGEYKHTLTAKELAPHDHTANNFVINRDGGKKITVGSGNLSVSYWNDGTATTDISEGGQSHNNIQPYKTCYRWERIA